MIPDAAKPYIIGGIALAWVGSLVAVGLWQNSAGATSERDAWQKRENKELVEANQKIIELNNEARETERRYAATQAVISADYQGKLQNAKAQYARDVAAARDGALVLRYDTPARKAGGSQIGSTPPGSCGCDGGTQTELPRTVTEFLLSLANEADEVVMQLTACQAVLRSDRGM